MSLTLNMVGGGGGSLSATDALLRVQAPAGSTVTISKNGTTKTDLGHESADDSTVYDYYFIIHQSQFDSVNAWTVTATNSGVSLTQTVIIDSSNEYDLVFLFEFGVSWDRSSSTAFTRLGDSANFSNPVPAVGTGDGSSPFDNIYPWSGMKEFNVINNTLSYERGVDSEFSRTDYDTVVRIPKFYYNVVNGDSATEYWISPIPLTGYLLHPAFEGKDYIYVGKYITGTGTVTKSGISPMVNYTRANARTNARNKGANWDMINFMVYSVLQLLYLVEFADWNCQSLIGNGYSDASSSADCGGTDSITYHTGRGTDTYSQIKYRGIEDLWGNVWQLCDGLNFNTTTCWYCLDRTKYADSTSTNYTRLSYTCVSATTAGYYPKTQGYDANIPFLFLATSVGGSNSTYIPDEWMCQTSGWRVFSLGGAYNKQLNAGLFCRHGTDEATTTFASVGSRLLFIP